MPAMSKEAEVGILLALFPFGWEMLGLPHSKIVGIVCWSVCAIIALDLANKRFSIAKHPAAKPLVFVVLMNVLAVIAGRYTKMVPTNAESLPTETSQPSTGKPTPHVSSKVAYPWVSANYAHVENGEPVRAVSINYSVLNWPTTNDDFQNGLSADSLFHLKIDVWMVEFLVGDGQRQKAIAHLEAPEWNNSDTTNRPIEWIPLDRETTVLVYRAEARQSSWDGYLILRKVGSNLDTEEATSGAVTLGSGQKEHMVITKFTYWKDGKLLVRTSHKYGELKKTRLKELGIPEIQPSG
jgi:hypothetical protein